MNQEPERTIVIAVFAERTSLQEALANDQAAATTLEILADEAIVVRKEADGRLTISRSDHSPTRSVAVMAAKLMLVVPLGFHGVLAMTTAGLQLSAAARERHDATDGNA